LCSNRSATPPLLRLARIAAQFTGIEIYAKAEFLNPGGSVKDRAALAMIRMENGAGLWGRAA